MSVEFCILVMQRFAVVYNGSQKKLNYILWQGCSITRHILLILPKSSTDIVHTGKGWIHHRQTLFKTGGQREAEQPSRQKSAASFRLFYRLPAEGPGQIRGGWQNRGDGRLQKKDRTSCCPWGEIYWFPPIPSPPLSVKTSVPLLSRSTILMEKSAKWKETWVGGTAGCDVESKEGKKIEKRRRFYCVSLMVLSLSESKWASDGKKEDAERRMEERIKYKNKAIRHRKRSNAPGMQMRALFDTPNRQWGVCSCVCVSVCIGSIQFHISSCSTYKKRSLISVNEMMLNRPQEALTARFASQAWGQLTVDNGSRGKKGWCGVGGAGGTTPGSSNQNGSGFPSSLFALSSIYPFFSPLQPSLLLAGVICSPSHLVSGWLCSLWWPTSHEGTALPLSAFKTRGWHFCSLQSCPPRRDERGTVISCLSPSVPIKIWCARWIRAHLFKMWSDDKSYRHGNEGYSH